MSIAVSASGCGRQIAEKSSGKFWFRHFACFVAVFVAALHFWEIAIYGFGVYQSGLTPSAVICMSGVNAILFWLPQVAILFWIQRVRHYRPEAVAAIGAFCYVTLSSVCDAVMHRLAPESLGSGRDLSLVLIELLLFVIVVAASAFMALLVCPRTATGNNRIQWSRRSGRF